MARLGATLLLPVSLTWDDSVTDAAEAQRDLYRMLEEVEQAGFFERNLVDITYGEPVSVTPFDADEFEPPTVVCVGCGQPIWIDHVRDNHEVWTHIGSGLGECDPSAPHGPGACPPEDWAD